MTTEDKQILLQDICARLPYGVNFKQSDSSTIKMRSVGFETKNVIPINLFFKKPDFYLFDNYGNLVLKPYLRPLSSMTEKEMSELRQWGSLCMTPDYCVEDVGVYGAIHSIPVIDWLNAHHFDYRGMIEKGLALPAKEGMY